MIDKLWLHSEDFTIENGKIFSYPQGTLDGETGEVTGIKSLFIDDSGKNWIGAKAYKNFGNFSADIDQRGLLVQFNPSNLNKTFVGDISHEDYMRVCKDVQLELGMLGIGLNLFDSELVHVDLKRDREVKNPFEMYHPLFKSLSARKESKTNYTKTYGTSFYFGNNSRKLLFYDKLIELRNRHIEISGYKNPMRAELRLLKKTPVQTNLEISTLKELSQKPYFSSLDSRYKTIVKKMFIGQREDNVAGFNFDSEIQVLSYFREKYPRNAVYEYLTMVGINEIINKFGDLTQFRTLLEACDFDKASIWRWLNRINKKIAESTELRKELKTGEGISALYDELYLAFAA